LRHLSATTVANGAVDAIVLRDAAESLPRRTGVEWHLQHLPDEPCLSEPHAPQEPCAHDAASAAAPGHATEGKYQRSTLVEVLQRYRWNVSAAARQLGISRSTLYRQMSRFHIVEPNHREGR
jgi:transcriptional regulator of acetoin/glycerol metabolism